MVCFVLHINNINLKKSIFQRDDIEPYVVLFSLIALEKFAQTSKFCSMIVYYFKRDLK